jgi:NAD(P)-dependent dehydrogenase (short-subunit alcohol dehydrogenase family)
MIPLAILCGVLTGRLFGGSLEWSRAVAGKAREMSLRARSYQRIPTRTVVTAWAACPKGTPAMLVRDRLDVVFEDEEFADLYPADGRPGLSPGQLADPQAVREAVDLAAAEFGRLDILVDNAGIGVVAETSGTRESKH